MSGTSGNFQGADVGRLAKVAQDFQKAAQKTEQTITFVRALIVALNAAAFFTGGASRAYASYLQHTVLPWLQKVLFALRTAIAVLSRQIGDQETASSLATLGIDALGGYRTPQLPTTDCRDYPLFDLPAISSPAGDLGPAGLAVTTPSGGVGAVVDPTTGLDAFVAPPLSVSGGAGSAPSGAVPAPWRNDLAVGGTPGSVGFATSPGGGSGPGGSPSPSFGPSATFGSGSQMPVGGAMHGADGGGTAAGAPGSSSHVPAGGSTGAIGAGTASPGGGAPLDSTAFGTTSLGGEPTSTATGEGGGPGAQGSGQGGLSDGEPDVRGRDTLASGSGSTAGAWAGRGAIGGDATAPEQAVLATDGGGRGGAASLAGAGLGILGSGALGLAKLRSAGQDLDPDVVFGDGDAVDGGVDAGATSIDLGGDR